MAVNYTSKTQFLFRVNKGVLDVTEHRALNEFMPEEKRRVPFSNMIYIGDGLTDVPSMKLTKLNGGHSIAVWQEDEQISNEMLLEGRVDFAVKADYSRGSDMEKMVFAIIDQIAASAKTAQMHVAACDRRRTPFKRADAAERIGNMKKRKLLVLDIDGTLTNTQKDITPKTLEAIFENRTDGPCGRAGFRSADGRHAALYRRAGAGEIRQLCHQLQWRMRHQHADE